MNRVRLTVTATILSAATWVSSPDRAEASEWGCEVLLCASSSNPSWRGVPACHPPMHRLISAMKGWGFRGPLAPKPEPANLAMRPMTSVPQVGALDPAIRIMPADRPNYVFRFGRVVRRALAAETVAIKP